MAISVLFFFFSTRNLDDCFSFPLPVTIIRRENFRFEKMCCAYAAGLWTIDEPMEENSKVLWYVCDRLCSTLRQQRRWMVAYSLAEAFTAGERGVRDFPSLSWLSRSWAENIYSRAYVYVLWRTPILCSPSFHLPRIFTNIMRRVSDDYHRRRTGEAAVPGVSSGITCSDGEKIWPFLETRVKTDWLDSHKNLDCSNCYSSGPLSFA